MACPMADRHRSSCSFFVGGSVSSGMQVYVNQFHGDMTANVVPLAAGLITASAKADSRVGSVASFEIRVDRDDPQVVVSGYLAPDVLAFSCYTWNVQYSLEVARLAKQAFPDCLMVFGGPSVPRREERIRELFARSPQVDVLVLGEGEVTFPELLAAHSDGADFADIPGLAFRDPSARARILFNGARERMTEFSTNASPYLDGTFDELMDVSGLAAGSAVVETNRGCPFSCTFCDWGQATQSRVHEIPIERVRAELEWMVERRIPYLYLIDANFGIRRRDVSILGHLGDLKARSGFPAFCYFHMTKNATERNLATVTTLVDAGIGCQVALSMQDFDDGVLKAIKRENISIERSLRLRSICNDLGIPTFNELLLGLPEQTYASFTSSVVNAVTPYPKDSFFLYLCRLLENAEMASAEQRELHGIQTVSCRVGAFHRRGETAYVDEHEDVVVATSAMPPEDWKRAYRFGQFLCTMFNMRLLDVVMLFIEHGLHLDLQEWVEAVLERISEAPDGSVLAELEEVLQSYTAAILEQGTALLDANDGGGQAWPVGDALLMSALTRRVDFIAEVKELTQAFVSGRIAVDSTADASPEVIDELFRYQELLTPGPDRTEPFEQQFTRNWLDYHQSCGVDGVPEACAAPITLRHQPPYYANVGSPSQFLLAHLAVLYAKSDLQMVQRV